MDVVRSIADRVAVIDAGRIVEEGDVWAVFANPQMPITRSLLAGSRPQLPEHLRSVLDPANGSDLVLSVDLAGDYVQGRFFADLSDAFARGLCLVEGGLEHIRSKPVARFFLLVPRSEVGLAEQVQARLTSADARVEVLGYV